MSRSVYTPELAEHILGEVRRRREVKEICRDEGMPCADTVFEWIRRDHQGFGARYREARQVGHGKAGRVGYSREIADRAIEELMGGAYLYQVCAAPDMPGLTAVCAWIATNHDGFGDRYRAARVVGQTRKADVRYTREIADEVLNRMREGRFVVDICADPDMPSASAVYNWVNEDRDGFAERFRQAQQAGWLAMAHDMIRVVDDRRSDWLVWRSEDGTVHTMLDPERTNRARLRAETRWKVVSKTLPKLFGEPDGARAAGSDAAKIYEGELAEMQRLIAGGDTAVPDDDASRDEKEPDDAA